MRVKTIFMIHWSIEVAQPLRRFATETFNNIYAAYPLCGMT